MATAARAVSRSASVALLVVSAADRLLPVVARTAAAHLLAVYVRTAVSLLLLAVTRSALLATKQQQQLLSRRIKTRFSISTLFNNANAQAFAPFPYDSEHPRALSSNRIKTTYAIAYSKLLKNQIN